MKWLLLIGLFAAFLVAATYALKAEWIRDQVLNWTAKAYGANSLASRLQRSFVGNAQYVATFRIVAVVVAIALLAAIMYVITAGPIT